MKKIIIADNLKSLVDHDRLLREWKDFNIFTARTSEDACNIHRIEKVNLIIVDFDIPGMGGDKVFSMIRKDDVVKKVSIFIPRGYGDLNSWAQDDTGSDSDIGTIDPDQFSAKLYQLLTIPERKDLRASIKVAVKGAFMNEYFICKARNISTSGILIETRKLLKKGNIITCSFALQGFGTIITEGEVMRIVKNRKGKNLYGIKFLGLNDELREAIEAFVRAQQQAEKS